jgi:hypothetical protein
MARADSFFDRCKGKRVVAFSSIKPLCVAERWIPDLVRMTGARCLERDEGRQSQTFTWEEIVAARPDVLIVAPEGASLSESVRTLALVQDLPQWEEHSGSEAWRGDLLCGSRTVSSGRPISKGRGNISVSDSRSR